MVLADHVGVVALCQQHLRKEAVLERNVAVVAGIAGGELGDGGHSVGMVVAPGDDARTRRRTQGRGVHVGVAQAALCKRVQVGRLDGAAEAAELAIPGVIQHDEQHVGRTFPGAHGFGPGRAGLIYGQSDVAWERSSWFVLFECHVFLLTFLLV